MKRTKTQTTIELHIGRVPRLVKMLILPLYILAGVQRIKCRLFKRTRQKLYVNCADEGTMPTDGFLTVECAEELKFKAVEEAVLTYRKQTNKQWGKLLNQGSVLRIKNIELQRTIQSLLKPGRN